MKGEASLLKAYNTYLDMNLIDGLILGILKKESTRFSIEIESITKN